MIYLSQMLTDAKVPVSNGAINTIIFVKYGITIFDMSNNDKTRIQLSYLYIYPIPVFFLP